MQPTRHRETTHKSHSMVVSISDCRKSQLSGGICYLYEKRLIKPRLPANQETGHYIQFLLDWGEEKQQRERWEDRGRKSNWEVRGRSFGLLMRCGNVIGDETNYFPLHS